MQQGAPWARRLAKEHSGRKGGERDGGGRGGGGAAGAADADENDLGFDALRARYPTHSAHTAQTLAAKPKAAISDNLGFGGHNAALVFKAYE